MNRILSRALAAANAAPRSTWRARLRSVFTFLVLAGLSASVNSFGAEPLKPRPALTKPAKTVVDRVRHETDRIYVKFRDDLPVRLRNGKLTAAGIVDQKAPATLFARLEASGAKWAREHGVAEAKLSEMRETAQKNTGKAMPDLNTSYILNLAKGMDAAKVIDELNALEIVEIALPVPRPSPPPVAPDYEPDQGYLDPATDGIDADFAATVPGGTGADVRIADIEYSWNLNHTDLPAVTLLGGTPVAHSTDPDHHHGTAVLGILAGRANNVGVSGIARGSTFFVASQSASGSSPAAAITTAAAALRAGDIIVLEMQADGPDTPSTTDFVPIEWVLSVYNAIVTAVGNGIIVVEAAGNGSQNLNDGKFATGHEPFRPDNDSGAIIVGAGAPPEGADGDRSRLGFSSFGSTVDLQGWGESVVTTGYGDLYSAEGTNNFYTDTFDGTSSATPIVAGACAALQGAYKASHGGGVLSPRAMREILRTTGSLQQAGTHPTTENIGPRPNLEAAMRYVVGPTIWVDFAFLEYPPFVVANGSFDRPYSTINVGVTAVPSGGTVIVKTGNTAWTGTISKPLTFRSFGGIVTIGR